MTNDKSLNVSMDAGHQAYRFFFGFKQPPIRCFNILIKFATINAIVTSTNSALHVFQRNLNSSIQANTKNASQVKSFLTSNSTSTNASMSWTKFVQTNPFHMLIRLISSLEKWHLHVLFDEKEGVGRLPALTMDYESLKSYVYYGNKAFQAMSG